MDVFNGHGKQLFVGSTLDTGPTITGVSLSTVNGNEREALISLPPDQARLAAMALMRYAHAVDGQRAEIESQNEKHFALEQEIEDATLALCAATGIAVEDVASGPQTPLMQIAAILLRRDIAANSAPMHSIITMRDAARHLCENERAHVAQTDRLYAAKKMTRSAYVLERAAADALAEHFHGRASAFYDILTAFGYSDNSPKEPITIPGAEQETAAAGAAGNEAAK